jgi:signal transduction histidine kinase
LLQELGERLVSSADVALVELIKNAYDADAPTCTVSRSDDSMAVVDFGHGMTEDEFLGKWMRIATGDKQRQKFSRKYKRLMTGAKGIGRFAVRFLGRNLFLESTADDLQRQCRTRLTANFDWEAIDQSTDLRLAKIPYEVRRVDATAPLGTTLTISRLRDPDRIDFGRTLRSQVLGIVSPIGGLDRGRFGSRKEGTEDPGFTLQLPGHEEAGEVNLAEAVLSHCYARLVIDHEDSHIGYTITHKDGRVLLKRRFSYPSHISRGIYADIRYFPRRSGMFQGTEVNGVKAWSWVRENCGVGVVDHGFRIRPYGLESDDWLHLGTDSAHSERDWRSKLMKEFYPIEAPDKDATKEKANPMLYLPKFHQLVGAVFVESSQSSGSTRPTDLTPAINREGYVNNEAFDELVEIVRTGMELLALADHRENRRLEREKAKDAAKDLRSDFRAAVSYIQTLPSLTDADKDRLTTEYSVISKQLEDVEDYYRQANQRMDIMAMLGVLAGFMTHEAKRLVSQLELVAKHLDPIAKKDAYVARVLPDIRGTLEEFRGQVDYSTLFIASLQDTRSSPGPIPVLAQVDFVVDRFARFVSDRDIHVSKDIDENLIGPKVPVAAYSGIVLNLYTNALKAVLAGPVASSERHVALKAWNEGKWHVLEVADNGVGIPPHLRKRIWDPLFTTTSGGSGNPLGSGMGLGLSLVRDIVSKMKGHIALVDPPPEFSTCFRVQLPMP